MKITKINLLINTDDYKLKAKYFRILHQTTLIYTIVVVVAIISFLVLNTIVSVKVNALNAEKTKYLGTIQQESADEAKLIYITKKMNGVDIFLADDVKFEPYYNLLVNSLGESTESAKLESFKLDKTHKVDFVVRFTNFSDMVKFLSFVESDDFVKSFQELSLQNFTSGNSKKEGDSFRLTFKGIFNKINE